MSPGTPSSANDLASLPLPEKTSITNLLRKAAGRLLAAPTDPATRLGGRERRGTLQLAEADSPSRTASNSEALLPGSLAPSKGDEDGVYPGSG